MATPPPPSALARSSYLVVPAAVMAVVVLPILPRGPYGPWGGVEPRTLWVVVLLLVD